MEDSFELVFSFRKVPLIELIWLLFDVIGSTGDRFPTDWLFFKLLLNSINLFGSYILWGNFGRLFGLGVLRLMLLRLSLVSPFAF